MDSATLRGSGSGAELERRLRGEGVKMAAVSVAPDRRTGNWTTIASHTQADVDIMRAEYSLAHEETIAVDLGADSRHFCASNLGAYVQTARGAVDWAIERAEEYGQRRHLAEKLARQLRDVFYRDREREITRSIPGLEATEGGPAFRIPVDVRTRDDAKEEEPERLQDEATESTPAGRARLNDIRETVLALVDEVRREAEIEMHRAQRAKGQRPFGRAAVPDAYRELQDQVLKACHYTYHYHALATEGALSVIADIAENLISARFGVHVAHGKTPNSSAWREGTYGANRINVSPVLRMCHRLLAQQEDTESSVPDGVRMPERFRRLLVARDPESLGFAPQDLPFQDKVDSPWLSLEPGEEKARRAAYRKQLKPFLERYLEDAVREVGEMGAQWSNHPKEEQMLGNIASYFRAVGGEEGRLIIYTSDAHHARYLQATLRSRFGELGVQPGLYLGSSHMKKSERDKELADFRNGNTNILITTSAGFIDHEVPPVDRIECFVPARGGRNKALLRGKLAHHQDDESTAFDDEAHARVSRAQVNIYVTVGTTDERAASRADREYRRIRGEYRT